MLMGCSDWVRVWIIAGAGLGAGVHRLGCGPSVGASAAQVWPERGCKCGSSVARAWVRVRLKWVEAWLEVGAWLEGWGLAWRRLGLGLEVGAWLIVDRGLWACPWLLSGPIWALRWLNRLSVESAREGARAGARGKGFQRKKGSKSGYLTFVRIT
jgi:hypothetical protein